MESSKAGIAMVPSISGNCSDLKASPMTHTVLISVLGSDHLGLVAALTGRLYDMGANLGDTSFSVLGTGFEFTSVVELPADVSADQVADDLAGVPLLRGADITVQNFRHQTTHDESGRVTHRIRVEGGDQVGIVARMSEVFVEFGANIVRMSSEKIPDPHGDRYTMIYDVWIPEDAVNRCLATVDNTAQQMQMACDWAAV
jgi:glycine cleavage system transcriptional repressor